VGESYVRPVVGAHEPAPEWHAVWRFRAVAFVLLAILAVVTVKGVDALLHNADQDPTSGNPAPSAPATPGPVLPS
jgi:hypothetical protein